MNYQQLYQSIYAAPLSDIRTIMLLSVAVWAALTYLMTRRPRSARVWTVVNRVLAACSVCGVLVVTFLSRSQSVSDISLRLFHIPEEDWRAAEYARMLLMNVLLYLPLGLSLSNAWPTDLPLSRRVSYTCAGGIALSFVCETLQFVTSRGTAEIDDIVTNAGGAALGAAAIVAAWLVRQLENRIKSRKSGSGKTESN